MTNIRKHFLAILFSFFLSPVFSQIENVVVETYYISDSNDATDTTGGGIEVGTKTYRVYLDLLPGTRVKKIYGDINHPLIFSSTQNFFNNKVDGQTFGKEFTKNRLGENTVALDTWITLGQTTRSAAVTYFGVLKVNDENSFIGGSNNDGGSAVNPNGLLTNTATELGIPLTEKDGMDTTFSTPTSWADNGFLDVITGLDSTIFGSIVPGNKFESRNVSLINSGVMGVDSLLNHVLVAQLSTKGEIAFELNIEVEVPSIIGFQTLKYVANDSVIGEDEVLSPFLKYPQQCGCQDANYLEYSPIYACNNPDSCRNLIVFGCMDPMACNFSSTANFNIQDICCYIGDCNDLDISLVCPTLGENEISEIEKLRVFPNPASETINVKHSFTQNNEFKIKILDQVGRVVSVFTVLNPEISTAINISNFAPGIYFIELTSKDGVSAEKFIKQ
jgi:hypothetical protein